MNAKLTVRMLETARSASTAPTGPVRGSRRPWPAGLPEPRAHGRIADGGSPESRLERRTRWSAAHDSGRSERAVKPSATPSVVRIHHLPPPAKTARWLRMLSYAGRFCFVPHVAPCPAADRVLRVHGRIADGVRATRMVGVHRRLFHRWARTAALAACSGLTCAAEPSVHPPVPARSPGDFPGTGGRDGRVR